MRKQLLYLCLLSFSTLFAQTEKELQLSFSPTFEKQSILILEEQSSVYGADSIQITALKFFVSAIAFYQKDQVVFEEENSYHLIDIEDMNSLNIPLVVPENLEFDAVHFNLGIDSLTSEAGVFDGALDPTNGMYWTWQSGYINFKLEGTSPICPVRKNAFQFHLGGYRAPYNLLQKIHLNCINPSDDIHINIAIDQFLDQIKLSDTYEIMSPNKEALTLAKQLPTIFSIVE